MTIGPERSANTSSTNEQVRRSPEALASFIRHLTDRPSLEEVMKYRSSESLFIKAFKRASLVEGILTGMRETIDTDERRRFNRESFNMVEQDVLHQMRFDPVNILAEEYWRERRKKDDESKLMPLMPRNYLHWPQPSEWIPEIREVIDERSYEGTDARLLRILKGTTDYDTLDREDIELLATPQLFLPPVTERLAELGRTIDRDHRDWELIVYPGDNTAEDAFLLRRKQEVAEISGPVRESKVAEKAETARGGVTVLIGADNNTLFINGVKIYLVPPEVFLHSASYLHVNKDALSLLIYLKNNPRRMISHIELVESLEEALIAHDPGGLQHSIDKVSYIKNRVSRGRELLAKLMVGDVPLLSYKPEATNRGAQIGVMDFDLHVEHVLLS
jgi:hypothetical protein